MDFAIGGVTIAGLVFGIVEASKEFGVSGKGCQILAMVVGLVLVGTAQAIAGGMIPADVVPWVELTITALAGGLAAMGYYDFITKRVPRG